MRSYIQKPPAKHLVHSRPSISKEKKKTTKTKTKTLFNHIYPVRELRSLEVNLLSQSAGIRSGPGVCTVGFSHYVHCQGRIDDTFNFQTICNISWIKWSHSYKVLVNLRVKNHLMEFCKYAGDQMSQC